jgi:hypothetical protein
MLVTKRSACESGAGMLMAPSVAGRSTTYKSDNRLAGWTLRLRLSAAPAQEDDSSVSSGDSASSHPPRSRTSQRKARQSRRNSRDQVQSRLASDLGDRVNDDDLADVLALGLWDQASGIGEPGERLSAFEKALDSFERGDRVVASDVLDRVVDLSICQRRPHRSHLRNLSLSRCSTSSCGMPMPASSCRSAVRTSRRTASSSIRLS